jgi:hypothetical protein
MVRDPLDEVIEDLEQAAPAPAVSQMPDFAEMQRYIGVILHGSEDAKRRIENSPQFRQFTARLAATVGTNRD